MGEPEPLGVEKQFIFLYFQCMDGLKTRSKLEMHSEL